jgi:hypothetical protein
MARQDGRSKSSGANASGKSQSGSRSSRGGSRSSRGGSRHAKRIRTVGPAASL